MTFLTRLSGWLRGSHSPAESGSTAIIAGAPLEDGPLVRQMAEKLRQRALAGGGWAAEAGGVSLEAYLPEARRLVRGIALGDVQGGPPTP